MAENYEDKNREELNEILKERDLEIGRLEKLVNAYKYLSDMYNKELLEADRMLQAQEIVQDMMRVEKIEAERVIQAHECLEELTILEKKESVQLLDAKEKVNQLSMQELIEKDETLQKILSINKDIGTILELDSLLNNIVKSLMDSVKADNGMLFIREKTKLTPRIFINDKGRTHGKEYFNYCQNIIIQAANSRKSSLNVNNRIGIDNSAMVISSLAVPLVHKDNLLGVIYADVVSANSSLKSSDLYSAEIFAGQAAISINNSFLYESIKSKNRELLKLVNIKNEFITRFSDHLLKPVTEAREKLRKLESLLQNGDPEIMRETGKFGTVIDRIGNIVSKVISIGELESSVNELFKDTVDVGDFIENTILPQYGKTIRNKNLTVTINLTEEFASFSVNKAVLRVILDELMSNAIMYNKPNGSITIRGNTINNFLIIDIIDTGYGIRDEDKEKIFQQFYRSEDSLQRNESGAGLGLFMVKNSLSYYGGEVKMESVFGEGSTFSISFLAH